MIERDRQQAKMYNKAVRLLIERDRQQPNRLLYIF